MEALSVEAEKKLPEFTSQNISNLLYALGKLEHKPRSFLEASSCTAKPILGSFTPQVPFPGSCVEFLPDGCELAGGIKISIVIINLLHLLRYISRSTSESYMHSPLLHDHDQCART